MTTKTQKYRLSSTHDEDLANGRVVSVGGEVSLTESEQKNPHNKRLIDEGRLVPLSEPKKKEGDKS